MASIVPKVLFTWFLLLLFLVFLNLKLEETLAWNWFLVFLPMWIYDVILIASGAVQMFKKYRSQHSLATMNDPTIPNIPQQIWFLVCVGFKFAFQILLCVQLEYFDKEILMCYAAIPLWILLIMLLLDAGKNLIIASPEKSTFQRRQTILRHQTRTHRNDTD